MRAQTARSIFGLISSLVLVTGLLVTSSQAQQETTGDTITTLEEITVTPECYSPPVHDDVSFTSKAHIQGDLHRFRGFEYIFEGTYFTAVVSRQAFVETTTKVHPSGNPERVVQEETSEHEFDVGIEDGLPDEKVVDINEAWDGTNQETGSRAEDNIYQTVMSATANTRLTISISFTFFSFSRSHIHTYSSSDEKKKEFDLDTVPPEINITSPVDGSVVEANQTLSMDIEYSDVLSGVEPETLKIRLNGTDITDLFAIGSGSASASDQAESIPGILIGETNTLEVSVEDCAENSGNSQISFDVSEREEPIRVSLTPLQGNRQSVLSGQPLDPTPETNDEDQYLKVLVTNSETGEPLSDIPVRWKFSLPGTNKIRPYDDDRLTNDNGISKTNLLVPHIQEEQKVLTVEAKVDTLEMDGGPAAFEINIFQPKIKCIPIEPFSAQSMGRVNTTSFEEDFLGEFIKHESTPNVVVFVGDPTEGSTGGVIPEFPPPLKKTTVEIISGQGRGENFVPFKRVVLSNGLATVNEKPILFTPSRKSTNDLGVMNFSVMGLKTGQRTLRARLPEFPHVYCEKEIEFIEQKEEQVFITKNGDNLSQNIQVDLMIDEERNGQFGLKDQPLSHKLKFNAADIIQKVDETVKSVYSIVELKTRVLEFKVLSADISTPFSLQNFSGEFENGGSRKRFPPNGSITSKKEVTAEFTPRKNQTHVIMARVTIGYDLKNLDDEVIGRASFRYHERFSVGPVVPTINRPVMKWNEDGGVARGPGGEPEIVIGNDGEELYEKIGRPGTLGLGKTLNARSIAEVNEGGDYIPRHIDSKKEHYIEVLVPDTVNTAVAEVFTRNRQDKKINEESGDGPFAVSKVEVELEKADISSEPERYNVLRSEPIVLSNEITSVDYQASINAGAEVIAEGGRTIVVKTVYDSSGEQQATLQFHNGGSVKAELLEANGTVLQNPEEEDHSYNSYGQEIIDIAYGKISIDALSVASGESSVITATAPHRLENLHFSIEGPKGKDIVALQEVTDNVGNPSGNQSTFYKGILHVDEIAGAGDDIKVRLKTNDDEESPLDRRLFYDGNSNKTTDSIKVDTKDVEFINFQTEERTDTYSRFGMKGGGVLINELSKTLNSSYFSVLVDGKKGKLVSLKSFSSNSVLIESETIVSGDPVLAVLESTETGDRKIKTAPLGYIVATPSTITTTGNGDENKDEASGDNPQTPRVGTGPSGKKLLVGSYIGFNIVNAKNKEEVLQIGAFIDPDNQNRINILALKDPNKKITVNVGDNQRKIVDVRPPAEGDLEGDNTILLGYGSQDAAKDGDLDSFTFPNPNRKIEGATPRQWAERFKAQTTRDWLRTLLDNTFGKDAAEKMGKDLRLLRGIMLYTYGQVGPEEIKDLENRIRNGESTIEWAGKIIAVDLAIETALGGAGKIAKVTTKPVRKAIAKHLRRFTRIGARADAPSGILRVYRKFAGHKDQLQKFVNQTGDRQLKRISNLLKKGTKAGERKAARILHKRWVKALNTMKPKAGGKFRIFVQLDGQKVVYNKNTGEVFIGDLYGLSKRKAKNKVVKNAPGRLTTWHRRGNFEDLESFQKYINSAGKDVFNKLKSVSWAEILPDGRVVIRKSNGQQRKIWDNIDKFPGKETVQDILKQMKQVIGNR